MTLKSQTHLHPTTHHRQHNKTISSCHVNMLNTPSHSIPTKQHLMQTGTPHKTSPPHSHQTAQLSSATSTWDSDLMHNWLKKPKSLVWETPWNQLCTQKMLMRIMFLATNLPPFSSVVLLVSALCPWKWGSGSLTGRVRILFDESSLIPHSDTSHSYTRTQRRSHRQHERVEHLKLKQKMLEYYTSSL